MNLSQFLRAAHSLAKGKRVMRIKIHEVSGESLYLEYRSEPPAMQIVEEDGKPLSRKLQNKLFPSALAVLVSIYRGEEKKRYEAQKGKTSAV